MDGPLTGTELLDKLAIPPAEVEVVFVNGHAFPLAAPRIESVDRVALVPPGTPGLYRVLLGSQAGMESIRCY